MLDKILQLGIGVLEDSAHWNSEMIKFDMKLIFDANSVTHKAPTFAL